MGIGHYMIASLGKTLNANILTDALCGRLAQVSVAQWHTLEKEMKIPVKNNFRLFTVCISENGSG